MMKLSERMLNSEQTMAFDTVMSGVNCFITGGAGTGKTHLTKVLVHTLEEIGKNVMVVAPTGVAASAAGGATIHRGFGLPATVCINEKTMSAKVRVSKPLSIADAVVIDEVSMVRMDLFDSMIASIRKASAKSGKRIQVITVGDFYQLPPILKNSHGERKLIEAYYKRQVETPYAFLGNEWAGCAFTPIELKNVVRQNDAEFIRNLNLARIGDTDCIPYFNGMCRRGELPDAIHLYGTNRDVDADNLRCMDLIEGRNYIFDTLFDAELGRDDMKDVPNQVVLKPGARVMVTTNDTNNVFTERVDCLGSRVPYSREVSKFYNGSLGTVIELGQYEDRPQNDYAVVKLDSGPVLFFYRQSYPVYQYVTEGGHIRRRELGRYSQFPLRPAYAATIHKSQGQTYSAANIDPYCRNAGQLYVALSRVRSVDGISLDNDIEPWNLVVDPAVRDFYDNLGKKPQVISAPEPVEKSENEVPVPTIPMPEPLATKKQKAEKPEPRSRKPRTVNKPPKKKGQAPTPQGGRPARFPTGATSIRIPNELIKPLQDAISLMYPQPKNGTADMEKVERLIAFLEELNAE